MSRFFYCSILLILIFAIFVSCGKSPQDEIDDAIEHANILLSSGKCDDAVKTLEDVGRQNKKVLEVFSKMKIKKPFYFVPDTAQTHLVRQKIMVHPIIL